MIPSARLGRLGALGGVRFALVRSSGWAMAEYVAYPVMMLAAMPLYLWALGTTQYGQWMFLLTITGFGGLAGFGMGPTATHTVAAARGRNDMPAAIESARACLAITLISGVALALVIVLVGWNVGPRAFSKVATPHMLFIIFAFGALLLLMEQIDSVFAGILRGLERFDLSARLEIAAKTLQVILTALAASLTRDLVAVFVTTTITGAIRTGGKILAVRRLLPAGRISPKWAPGEMRAAFHFGKWIWLQGAGSLLFAVADRTLVGAMLGAKPLAAYAIALQLAQQVQTIPAAGAQVLFPAIAKRQEAGEDWGKLAIRATVAVGAIGIIGALLLLALGPWFLDIWVGPILSSQVVVVLPWLAIAYGLLSLPSGPHQILIGMGRPKLVAILTVTAGVIAALSIPLSISDLGFAGAPVGRSVYALLMLAMVPVLLKLLRQRRRGQSL
jgi:O-antigen/teichoic acid export membrane protein